jgi:uncharacterized protein
MSSFDLIWSLMQWRARSRRNARRLAARRRGAVRRRLWQTSETLSAAAVRSLSPGLPLPWWTDSEIERANQERAALFAELACCTHVTAGGAKYFTGALSPGCRACVDGTWGCHFINGRCNRDCFYCIRPHRMKVEPDPQSDRIPLRTPEEHVAFVRTFGIRGVGFSGGEPLLATNRLLPHLAALRRAFGNSVYLWMYTNGDLVTEPLLEQLREAGLDEIRFDLTARGYDLRPLQLARRHISTITVEIPAIPEDFERLKVLLVQLTDSGAKHLNLHQLIVGQPSWREMRRRGYHLSSQFMPTVHESELCILRLMAHACREKIALPINFCAPSYRFQFYARAMRARAARLALADFEEVTDAGYIRELWIEDSAEQIGRLVQRLEADGHNPGLWRTSGNRITLPSRLASYVDWQPGTRWGVTYTVARLEPQGRSTGFDPARLRTRRRQVRTAGPFNQAAFAAWQQAYGAADPDTSEAAAREPLTGPILSLIRLERAGGDLPEFI